MSAIEHAWQDLPLPAFSAVLTAADRTWLRLAGELARQEPPRQELPRRRLPAYCACCTCIKRYCICRCCCAR